MEPQEKNKKETQGKKENKFSIRVSTIFLNLIVVMAVCIAVYFTYSVISGNAPEVSSDPPFTPVTEPSDSVPPESVTDSSQITTSSGTSGETVSGDASESDEGSTSSDEVTFIGEYDRSFFDNTLFIGDSISTGLSLYGFLDADNVFALQGLAPSTLFSTEIDGDTCESRIASVKPERIVVMLGSNAIGYGSSEDLAAQMTTSLLNLKELFNGQLAVISVSPITMEAEASSDNMLTLSGINEYNELVKKSAEKNGIVYIDLYSALVDESGYFNTDYAEYDGIHFMGEAYKIMLSVTQKALE
ncbi:MAG: hypothetical protein J1E39_07820 [Eubacterium sp.]|nr:hypothetical protein [Eubacterium sp.]